MTITIVGLGPGDPGDLTRRAWETIANAETVFLRTQLHPTVPHLPEGPAYRSFDELYESSDDFATVYDTIAARLLEAGEAVYAVPGDPLVAEGTVTRVLKGAAERGVTVEIVNGVSFIEPLLAALGVDAGEGVQIVDAMEIAESYHPPINPDVPAVVAQVYSRLVASDIKLALMNQYPDQHPVTLITAAGTDQQQIRQMPLYQIDHHDLDHLTSLYVPPFEGGVTSFEGFQNTVAHLRSPEGCPWDREQTHESLRRYIIEETYEVVDAIDEGDMQMLAEELGDLLLQIVLHAQIATEDGDFHMADVVRIVDDKMKRRHPHVWGDVDVQGDAQKVLANWADIKAAEREEKGEAEKSILDGVPKAMPALAQAHAYDLRAIKVGFDWPTAEGVVEKVREEIDEILTADTTEERAEEMGDLLLAIAVWARWLEVNPEDALRAANRKFYKRFTYLEKQAREQGRSLKEMTLEEMDVLWNEAKAGE